MSKDKYLIGSYFMFAAWRFFQKRIPGGLFLSLIFLLALIGPAPAQAATFQVTVSASPTSLQPGSTVQLTGTATASANVS